MTEEISDLDSFFGDGESDKNDKSPTRNRKQTRPESPRYSSFSGRLTYLPPSGAKSETMQRPVTASASLMYGLPEVQDYVPRPVTATGACGMSLKRRSKSLRSVKEIDNENSGQSELKLNADGMTEEEGVSQNRHVSFADLHPETEEGPLRFATSTPLVGSKSSTVILKHLHESLDEMIDEEDEIFKNKYSDWISELFHNELRALRKRLRTQFNSELEDLVAANEAGLAALDEKYQEKLMEFEDTSQSFRDWLDALEEENRHLQNTKDWEVSQIRQESDIAQRNLELQLEKQRSQMQVEHNREMERLIREHEKHLAQSTGQSAVSGQLNTLRRTVSSLKSQNIELQKQISTCCEIESSVQNLPELVNGVQDLRNRLDQSEREKVALCELHEHELSTLKESADKTINGLQSLLATSQDAMEAFQKAHDEEVMSLQNSLSAQEVQFNKTLSSLQSKYGSKIESLTDMIDRIQNEVK